MKLPSILSLTIAVNAIPAGNERIVSLGSFCGSEPSFEQQIVAQRRYSTKAKHDYDFSIPFYAEIDVHFHSILYSNQESGLYEQVVYPIQIKKQIDVLNNDFKPFGIEFKLASFQSVFNDTWAAVDLVDDEYDTIPMKKALHKGGKLSLNIYTTSFKRPSYNGYSSFPWDYEIHPELDGIVVSFDTLPDGTNVDFSGITVTHEVGHWLGLYHIYRGEFKCDTSFENGDWVDDTPIQTMSDTRCQPRDTCPELPGVDLVNNHMDFTINTCANSFTPGQIKRAQDQLRAFRL